MFAREVLGKCTETLKQVRQLSLTNIPTLYMYMELKSTAGEDYTSMYMVLFGVTLVLSQGTEVFFW